MKRERRNRKRFIGLMKMKRYKREFYKGPSILLECGTVSTGMAAMDLSYRLPKIKRIQDIDCD